MMAFAPCALDGRGELAEAWRQAVVVDAELLAVRLANGRLDAGDLDQDEPYVLPRAHGSSPSGARVTEPSGPA